MNVQSQVENQVEMSKMVIETGYSTSYIIKCCIIAQHPSSAGSWINAKPYTWFWQVVVLLHTLPEWVKVCYGSSSI